MTDARIQAMIDLAKSQVGYHEGYSGGHWNNHTKYPPEVPGLEWAQNQPWCATFVSWLALKCGLSDYFPRTASVPVAARWFKDRGRWSEYPAIGAQVIFGNYAHTGFVVDYDSTYVWTVEGNTNTSGSAEGDGVYLKKHERRSSWVLGYGYPKVPLKSADPRYATAEPAPEAPVTNWTALPNWKLTVPVDGSDSGSTADEVRQPQLASYDSIYFDRHPEVPSITFYVKAGGATTPGSSYPRTELREVHPIAWSNRSGSHMMSETWAINYLPKGVSIVIGQIHDDIDDVLMIRATGLGGGYVRIDAGLGLGKGAGNDWKPLAAKVAINARFKITTYATKEGIAVKFNNVEKARWSNPRRSDKCYWKCGAYLQTNTSGVYAKATLYGLSVEHR